VCRRREVRVARLATARRVKRAEPLDGDRVADDDLRPLSGVESERYLKGKPAPRIRARRTGVAGWGSPPRRQDARGHVFPQREPDERAKEVRGGPAHKESLRRRAPPRPCALSRPDLGVGRRPGNGKWPLNQPGKGPPGPTSVPTSTRRAHSGHRPPLPRDEHEHEYQEGWKERRLRAARAQLVAARGSLPWGSRDSSRSACCSRPGPPGGALEQGGRHRVELPPVPVRPADSNAPGFVSTRGDATLRPSSWIGPQCPTSAGAGGGTSRGR
jgi:hypothetical protein